MNDFDVFKGIMSAIMAIALVAATIMTAQKAATQEDAEIEINRRFEYAEGITGVADIIVDNETGVCYIWKTASYKGGLTVLVDADGKPVIWKEVNK